MAGSRSGAVRVAVAAVSLIMLFESGYVVPAAAASQAPVQGPLDPEPDAAPPADDTPVLDPADEVVTARTESTRTYDLGNGRFAVEAFADPLFYQPEGSADWLPIDLDFALIARGASAAVTQAPVQISVGTAADGLVAIEHDGYRIALRPTPVTRAARAGAAPIGTRRAT